MKRLPLYTDRTSLIERVEGKGYDPDCKACDLHTGCQNVCLPPVGESGDNVLLVVLNTPTALEDTSGMGFVSNSAEWLRLEIEKQWDGQVIYTYGIRCASGRSEVTDTMMSSCRPYLAEIVRVHKPKRVLTFGTTACWAMLGRKVPPRSVRKGYGVLSTGARVFHLQPMGGTLSNSFRREHLIDDLNWALRSNPPEPPWDAKYNIIETVEDARQFKNAAKAHGSITFDTEYSGPRASDYFRIDTLAVCLTGEVEAWVWDEKSMTDPALLDSLREVFEDPEIEQVGHNVKVDVKAVYADRRLKATCNGDVGDTLIWRKLDEPDIQAKLAYQSEMVGMGGHKEEMENALTDAIKTIEQTRLEWDADQITLPGCLPRALEAAVKWPGMDPMVFAYGLVNSELRARYCALDTVSTSLLAKLSRARLQKRPHIDRAWNVLLKTSPKTIAAIETSGFAVDRGQIENVGRFVDAELAKLDVKLKSFDCPQPSKTNDLVEYLYGKLKLPVLERTKHGNPSTNAKVLKKLQGKHPVIDTLLSWKEFDTVRARYGWGLLDYVDGDGRIHGSFNIMGTVTGRFSCVAPGTPIKTARGTIPVERVRVGDHVWTHRERWRPVTRAWVKGREQMVRVRFSNGEVLCCTRAHRMLRSDGHWTTVGQVIDECFEALDKQTGECGGSCRTVSGCSGYTDSIGHCKEPRNNRSQRPAHSTTEHPRGGTSRVEGIEVLRLQDGFTEPDEGEERQGSSALGRGLRGRPWLPDVPSQRQTGVRASCGNGGSVGPSRVAADLRCAPHRRGPEEQHHRQSGFGDAPRTSNHSFFAGEGQPFVSIEEIDVGAVSDVFDLTVAEDSSYFACGVFSHNSSDPNMQNIPSRSKILAAMIKNIFVAPPGRTLIQIDYSQLEYRVASYLSGDQVMQQVFRDGLDLHRRTAELIANDAWGIPQSVMEGYDKDQIKPYRSASKAVNFGTLYGLSAGTLAKDLGITKAKAERLIAMIMGQFQRLAQWVREQEAFARKHGFVYTYFDGKPGRWRPLWDIAGDDEAAASTARNSAINSPVQGSAAEYMLRSLNTVVPWLSDERLPAQVVGTVHDSMILEVANDWVEEVVEQVVYYMQSWDLGDVPLIADVEKGPRWGKLKEVPKAENGDLLWSEAA